MHTDTHSQGSGSGDLVDLPEVVTVPESEDNSHGSSRDVSPDHHTNSEKHHKEEDGVETLEEEVEEIEVEEEVEVEEEEEEEEEENDEKKSPSADEPEVPVSRSAHSATQSASGAGTAELPAQVVSAITQQILLAFKALY